jgi:hypothetical protein
MDRKTKFLIPNFIPFIDKSGVPELHINYQLHLKVITSLAHLFLPIAIGTEPQTHLVLPLQVH